jgi:hypothetical protein
MPRRARKHFSVKRLGGGPMAGSVFTVTTGEQLLDRRGPSGSSEQFERLPAPLDRHRSEAGRGQLALQRRRAEAAPTRQAGAAGSDRRPMAPEHVEHRHRPARRAVQLAIQVAAGDPFGEALHVEHHQVGHPARPQDAPELAQRARQLMRQQRFEAVARPDDVDAGLGQLRRVGDAAGSLGRNVGGEVAADLAPLARPQVLGQ